MPSAMGNAHQTLVTTPVLERSHATGSSTTSCLLTEMISE